MNDGVTKVGQVWEFKSNGITSHALYLVVKSLDDGHRIRVLSLFTGETSLFASRDFYAWNDGSASFKRIA